MKTNYLKKYIISSYILVWMLIIFVAGSAKETHEFQYSVR